MPDFEPKTRNEVLLNAIAENTGGGGTGSVSFSPVTREEHLLEEIRKNTEGGGSGGSGLPDVTAADNEKILIVENGKWFVVTADGDLDWNSFRPIANSAVTQKFAMMQDDINMCFSRVFACDTTAQSALGQMIGGSVQLLRPNGIEDLQILLVLSGTGYLLWTNGTKLDFGKMLVQIDMTNNAITLYARGKSSMVSGVMGVDTSWTVTSL